MIRKYLELGRIHTAALTIPMMLISYLIGGGNLISITALEFSILALLFHYSGFFWNDWFDREIDKKQGKTWRPIFVLGERKALITGIIASVITFAFGTYLLYGTSGWYSFILAIFFGFLYNMFSKKVKPIAPTLISLSYVFALMTPYLYLETSHNLEIFIFFILFAYLDMQYQIAVSGEFKDLKDPQNILVMLGTRVREFVNLENKKERIMVYMPNNITKVFIMLVRTMLFLSFIMIMSNLDIGLSSIVGLFLFFLTYHYSMKQTEVLAYDRKYFTKIASVIEVLTYLSLVFVLYPLLGLYTLFFVVFPVVWFVVWNVIYWGKEHALAPKV